MGIFSSNWDGKERVEEALKRVFKLPEFRPGQEEIIRDITTGHDTLAVMPTGGGKSLCYQLPAIVTPGLTLVISPLIALMKDQVDALKQKGIRAEALHSGISHAEQQSILDDVSIGEIKILFVAPERLQTSSFQSLLTQIHVGLIAVDEAHCISQWGHDFRPAYRRIGALRTTLNDPPTIALTATASHSVQEDIVAQLHLKSPKTHILGFDRQNLLYSVKIFKTDSQKIEFILDFVMQNIQQKCFAEPAFQGCGIVYASTIKQAEMLYTTLNDYGIRTGIYHAGLSAPERTRIQDAFKDDAYHCLVATNAFGMGVDKPNIRYVIHMSLSGSVEAYTQEAGRAGRDRKPAQCILLYAPKDIRIQQSFIKNGAPDLIVYKTILEAFADKTKTKLPTPGSRTNLVEIKKRYVSKTGKPLNENLAEIALRKLKSLDHLDISQSNDLLWLSKCPSNLAKKMAEESKLQEECAEKRLAELINYANESKCRTKFILKYFGSREYKLFGGCSHCDLCHAVYPSDDRGKAGAFPPEPMKYVILKIISTVARYNLQKVDLGIFEASAMLHGAKTAKQEEFATTFGSLAYMSETEIRILIALMLEDRLIMKTSNQKLVMTERGTHFLKDKEARIEGYAPQLGSYISKRFPEADEGAAPWRSKLH